MINFDQFFLQKNMDSSEEINKTPSNSSGDREGKESSSIIITENTILRTKEEEEEILIANIFSKLPALPEITLEIFSRLPPQTIFKLQCVSKSFSNFTKQLDFQPNIANTVKILIVVLSQDSSTRTIHQATEIVQLKKVRKLYLSPQNSKVFHFQTPPWNS